MSIWMMHNDTVFDHDPMITNHPMITNYQILKLNWVFDIYLLVPSLQNPLAFL